VNDGTPTGDILLDEARAWRPHPAVAELAQRTHRYNPNEPLKNWRTNRVVAELTRRYNPDQYEQRLAPPDLPCRWCGDVELTILYPSDGRVECSDVRACVLRVLGRA
jgi:hypothetical protein